MPQDNTSNEPSPTRIDAVEVTSDTLTSRAGLALFVRYLKAIDLAPHLERLFGSLRKNRKGLPVSEVFRQMICFFVDGTSRHLVHFDRLRQDPGYAATIETSPERMASSHAVKRFLRSFWWPRIWLFRRLLLKLFLWRLDQRRPELIVLGLDTTVLNNDESQRRHGVQPTYRGVEGFAPLLLTWERYVVDAVLRGGAKHSNHGTTAPQMVRKAVGQIRKHYREDVPIVIRCDAGFFDDAFFAVLEELGVGFIGGGRLYEDLQPVVENSDAAVWGEYVGGDQVWDFLEFGDRRRAWQRFRRALYLCPRGDGAGLLLAFARPETVLYTNLGTGGKIDELLHRSGQGGLAEATALIKLYHARGVDELVIRASKDFAAEELPCKRFNMNAAYYYTLLLSLFLFEAFKEDVAQEVVPLSSYPTTVRRRLIDVAGKIVRHAGQTVLKVTEATYNQLRLAQLWRLSGAPPRFAWAH